MESAETETSYEDPKASETAADISAAAKTSIFFTAELPTAKQQFGRQISAIIAAIFI